MIERLVFGLGLFVGSMTLGYGLGRKGILTELRASAIMRVVVKWCSPIVLCLSFWRLELVDRSLLALPVIGTAVSLAALMPAWLYSRWARLTPAQTGSFLTCAMFSNVGYLGAFLAFMLYGEAAYGLCLLYFLLFSPCFYLVGFTLAKRYGHAASSSRREIPWAGELRLYPIIGMVVGASLNFAHVPRPAALDAVNHVLIPLDTVLCLTAIGSQLHLEPMGRWVGHGLAMSAIKFLYSPLVAWGLIQALRVQGVPRAVALIEATMPVAVSPLMLPMLFGLDRKFSSALFVLSHLAALVWFLFYLPLIR